MKKLIPLLTFFIVISCDFSNSLTNEQLYSIEKDAEEISKILIIIDEGSDKFMDKVYEGFNQDDFETKNLNKTIEKIKIILIDFFKDITRSKELLVKYQNLSKDYQKNLLKILEDKLYNNLSLKNEIRVNTPEAYISKSIRTLEREIALGRKTLEEMDSLKNDSLIFSSVVKLSKQEG